MQLDDDVDLDEIAKTVYLIPGTAASMHYY
jgi:hypothetical protein